MIGYLLFSVAGLLLTIAASAQHTVLPAVPDNDRSAKKLLSVHLASAPVEYSFTLAANGPLEHTDGHDLFFRSHVKNHRLHGNWQSWYANKQVLDSGHLVNGIPDGEWRRWDSSGQLLSLRHYDADKLQRVRQEWRNLHPKRSFYALTDLYRTNAAAAMHHTSAAYSFPSKEYEIKRPLGQTVTRNRTMDVDYRPVFDEGLLHGLYLNYFSGGQLRDSGYYKDGLKEGVWTHHNSPVGSWFTGAYKNGMRQYEWKHYDGNGKLKAIIFYNKEGEQEWRKEMK